MKRHGERKGDVIGTLSISGNRYNISNEPIRFGDGGFVGTKTRTAYHPIYS